MDRPSFQFYPEAWLADVSLRAVSSAARGLWIDMICLMHQGTPYGYLRLRNSNGGFFEPGTTDLAKMTGNTPGEIEKWISELDRVGVLGRKKDTIFSKKMVRDEKQRTSWRREKTGQRRRLSTCKPKDIRGNNVRPNVRPSVRSMSGPSPSPSSSPSPTPKKKEEKKGRAAASPVVYWSPEPVWEENHPSHAEAFLRVGDEHLKMLVRDYPTINVRDEIVNLKNKALGNPEKYAATRNWRARLTNWLKNAVVFDAERNGGSRASRPQSEAAAHVAWELEQEAEQRAEILRSIAACKKSHAPDQLTQRKNGPAYCGCGYREART